MDKEFIGKMIAKARKEMLLTQREVAFITGIDKTTISKIEHGRLNASIDTINKICNAVDLELKCVNFKEFKDLKFEKHPFHILADELGESYPNYKENKTCYQAKMKLANGLNISVVIGTPFCSNGKDTYEVSFWSENGFERIFGHQTKGMVDFLMERAQYIEDIRFLDLLHAEGFEHFGTMFEFIKQIGKWWVVVNPEGTSFFVYNEEPCNFNIDRSMVISDYEQFSSIYPKLEEFIDEKEKTGIQPPFLLLGRI